jgi:hypothetical protein
MFVCVFYMVFVFCKIVITLLTLFASIIQICSTKKPENIIIFLDSFYNDR